MLRIPAAAAAVAAVVLIPASASQDPQDPQQQALFRGGVQTVAVYATVTDRSGRLVPDLTIDDFEILDNGQPRPITLFKTEIEPFAAVLAMDSSASMTLLIPLVQQAAEQFVIRMLPDDRATAGWFNFRFTYRPGLTSDRDSLARYIREELTFGNTTRLWDAAMEAMDVLQDVTGRRVVLLLTDGDDWDSQASLGEVMLRAQTDSVMIYAIGLESRYHNGLQYVTSRPGGAIRRLAEQTGGGHFELSKSADLNSTFTRVIQELHSQYAMGFTPETLDGTEHTLEVRSKKAGMRVRARKSYIAK